MGHGRVVGACRGGATGGGEVNGRCCRGTCACHGVGDEATAFVHIACTGHAPVGLVVILDDDAHVGGTDIACAVVADERGECFVSLGHGVVGHGDQNDLAALACCKGQRLVGCGVVAARSSRAAGGKGDGGGCRRIARAADGVGDEARAFVHRRARAAAGNAPDGAVIVQNGGIGGADDDAARGGVADGGAERFVVLCDVVVHDGDLDGLGHLACGKAQCLANSGVVAADIGGATGGGKVNVGSARAARARDDVGDEAHTFVHQRALTGQAPQRLVVVVDGGAGGVGGDVACTGAADAAHHGLVAFGHVVVVDGHLNGFAHLAGGKVEHLVDGGVVFAYACGGRATCGGEVDGGLSGCAGAGDGVGDEARTFVHRAHAGHAPVGLVVVDDGGHSRVAGVVALAQATDAGHHGLVAFGGVVIGDGHAHGFAHLASGKAQALAEGGVV